MQIAFESFEELKPGPLWRARFDQHWDGYKQWFLRNGLTARATAAQSLRNLTEHMPEFVPAYQALCEASGGGDVTRRFLSLYRPPAYIAGCSQLVFGDTVPLLIRNYDYAPVLFDGFLLKSRWIEKDVVGMTDCLVGLLDGINSDGLCVSLAFGGSKQVGRGFGIPLIVRYVLETCDDAKMAKKALRRLPSHMCYNLTVVDRFGEYFTAYMRPGGNNEIIDGLNFATNHQRPKSEWPAYTDATYTYDRSNYLANVSREHLHSDQAIVDAFMEEPLYATRYQRGHGTLYTAVYSPLSQGMSLYWPTHEPMHVSLTNFSHNQQTIHYPEDSDSKKPFRAL